MNNKYKDRNKAFLGTTVASIGLASSVAQGFAARRKARKEQKRAKREAAYDATYSNAQALNQGYSDEEYIDNYEDRLEFKLGGTSTANRINKNRKKLNMYNNKAKLGTKINTINISKSKYKDRLGCGGKRKLK